MEVDREQVRVFGDLLADMMEAIDDTVEVDTWEPGAEEEVVRHLAPEAWRIAREMVERA